ncbi:hypothetical protein TUMSATVNIG3_05610 [Vibrio nigripulchritudo]|nr:hypothetical protein TUMSATVNIG2_05760 [Vibrio nigripulchritudo]BDU41763.1 hypothetical protein TUMSATVNIG3_05610 [Vibrio nigripulchritudo]
MGLDTAYIPVTKQDIDFYVGEIAQDPDLLDHRIQLLTQSREDRNFLRENIYINLFSQDEEQPFDNHFGFAACCILAYLRPYYYERGQSLMNIVINNRRFSRELLALFDRFSLCFPNARHCGDSDDLNYRSGVYIRKENVEPLLKLLTEGELQDSLALEEASGLLAGLKYADKHGTGLLEAFDIQVPISWDFYTSAFNLRADYLGNLEDETVEGDCDYTGFTIGIPVPSSTRISFDDFGAVVYEWMDKENTLPMHENHPNSERTTPGEIKMSMICQELTPLVMIQTKQNVFLRDSKSYFEYLRVSLAEHLTQEGLDANFFISVHDEKEVPEDIRSIKNAEIFYKMKPKFMLGNHKWSFQFDEQNVEMRLSLKGKMEVLLNDEKIDEYKVSFSEIHRTVYFIDGNWYTIRVRNTNPTAGELDIQLHKGIFLQAKFKFLQGSEVCSKPVNRVLVVGETLTIFFGVLIFIFPRVFVMLPFMFLLSLMIKYNKRHHFFIRPVDLPDEEPTEEP